MPSDTIGNKYKIVREIARSNDIVYEVIDTSLGRRLAVKELSLPPNLTGQALRERIERFNREARAAGKLTHPNIVTVYDFGEHDGRHFIAMEYLEGGTLRDVLQTRGALPLRDALEIATQVLSALAHAHSRQVVHRDVKPDNIHILPGGQIKLTDFGIARLTEEASLTGDGQVFGTPSYMSPEQIEGRFIDHRSDLFSLGILLYEMVAGRKPFTGDSVVGITHSIMYNDPSPLVGIPYGIEQVIFRALAKDPSRRFNSADEMRLALKNADATPAMFLQRQPTNLGYGTGMPVPYGTPGTGYGYPSVPMPGGAPAPTYGQPSTVYAPPPQAAPQSQSGGGPFVNWGPTGQPAPPGYIPPPPPFPHRQAGPLISEGAKNFLISIISGIAIGAILVGFILLFLRAYEQQQKLGPERAAQKIVGEGNALYQQGNLEQAASRFSDAIKAGPETAAAKTARINLAITYNRMGTRAFDRGDMKGAETYWYKALDVDTNNSDAHYNLGKLYDRIGDPERAKEEWQRSAELGRVGGSNPAAPGDNTVLRSRYERARILYNQGMEAYNNGDNATARENWQKAVGEAPGTDVAMKAQQMIDNTATGPSF